MINKILNDIDNEECYYVGINGCLYQDLDKEELLAIKQEIERLHNIIKEVREYIEHYETIRGYFEYEELGYDEYDYDEDLKQELLEILDKENKND